MNSENRFETLRLHAGQEPGPSYFNHPSTIGRTYGAGTNTWRISRIKI